MLIENSVYQEDLDKVIDAQSDWSQIDNHSFLIIGASGMIGSFMVDVLMQRNQKTEANIVVYAMGRTKAHLETRFESYLSNAYFHMVVADVTKPFPEDLAIDYIFHGASNTHPRAYATDPIGTIMTNLMGTEQVLKYAVKMSVRRVLFMSSVEIYGENRGDVEKFSEDYSGYIDCNTLRAGYPEGKRVSESLCQAYISKYGLDVVIPRICRTFGPTMKLDDSKASSQFILNAARDEDIVLKSEGNQYYSYAYVGDIVSALLFILVNGRNGQAYNIANSQFDLKLKDLAEKLSTTAKKKIVFDLPDKEELTGFSKSTTAILNPTKIRELGWKPIFALQTALTHTVELLRSEVCDDA